MFVEFGRKGSLLEAEASSLDFCGPVSASPSPESVSFSNHLLLTRAIKDIESLRINNFVRLLPFLLRQHHCARVADLP